MQCYGKGQSEFGMSVQRLINIHARHCIELWKIWTGMRNFSLQLFGDFLHTLAVIPLSTFADEIKTIRLTINMRVHIKWSISTDIFRTIIDIENDRIELQSNTHYNKLSDNFCTIVHTKTKLVIFSQKYNINTWIITNSSYFGSQKYWCWRN